MNNTQHGGVSAVNICEPKDIADSDQSRIGGKAAGLLRLHSVGATVPSWVVVDIHAAASHLQSCDPDGVLRQRLAAAQSPAGEATVATPMADEIASELQRVIISTPVSGELYSAIERLMDGRGPVAVRSSAVDEDGADRSYAGIFDSQLYCVGVDQVIDGIKKCWASACSKRALDYHTGASGYRVPDIAVVIQDMADGDVSGVLFTVDPTRGQANTAAISACWGLGEGIVSGLCATDEFCVDHSGKEVTATLADKDIEVIRAADGGIREAAIEDARRSARCLTTEQTALLVKEAVRIATALGSPQDIEWTLCDGAPVILQTRPITALAAVAAPGQVTGSVLAASSAPTTGSAVPDAGLGQWRTVWDNSNIQESFNGVTLPLTFSWAARVYEAIFVETLRMIGVSDSTITANSKVLRNMVGLVSGRVYYNINNWYRVLRMAPFFERNKEDVERMIGVENPVDFIEGIHAGAAERLARVPQLAPVFVVLGWRMANRARLVDRFQREVGSEIAQIRTELDTATDLESLLELSARGLRLFDRWAVQILNDLYLSNQAGRARRILAASGNSSSEETIAGLLASEEAVESLQPTLILMRLASDIRSDAHLAQCLFSGTAREAYDEIRASSTTVRRILDDYVEVYGDRCMGEQKLETISLRQDPAFIVSILRNYVRDDSVDAQVFERDQAQRRVEFEAAVLGPIPRRQREKLTGILRRARTAVRDRERMRLSRTRIVGVGRSIYLKVGELLYSAGQLDDPRHVFYLTMEEIQAFSEGRSVTGNLAALVRVRVEEFDKYQLVEPPNQFQTLGPPYSAGQWSPPEPQSAEPTSDGEDSVILRGTGCWPGIVEGSIQVVLSPDDDLDVRGKIMTTMRTDPGWGPLFPSVAGLLIERGSTLSHSAVLARELGIPAVVGVRGLMAKIRDGETVRLDGGTGEVERLDET